MTLVAFVLHLRLQGLFAPLTDVNCKTYVHRDHHGVSASFPKLCSFRFVGHDPTCGPSHVCVNLDSLGPRGQLTQMLSSASGTSPFIQCK